MQKSELRNIYKDKRRQITPEERTQLSEQICNNIIQHTDFSRKIISLFLPIHRLNEVDTSTLFLHLQQSEGTRIALSVSGFEDFSMRHQLWSPDIIIKDNSWGIPEPQNGELIANHAIDIVIVPMLICDQRGYRVGYGKGFYDRFIAQCKKKVRLIGVNYFAPIGMIHNDFNDIPVHTLYTPDSIFRFKK